MHLALVSSNSSGTGGGERYLQYLAEGLLKRGHLVTSLLSRHAYMDCWAKNLERVGAQVLRGEYKSLSDRRLRFLTALLDLPQQSRIRSQLRLLKPDHIHVNQQYDEDALDYIVAALGLKAATVSSTIHLPMTANKNERPLGQMRGWALGAWYGTSDYTKIFVSHGSLNEFCSYYTQANRCTLVHTGVFGTELENAWTTLSKQGQPGDAVGFVGRLVKQKRPEFVVEIWRQLLASGLSLPLIIVGDGPLREELRERLTDSRASVPLAEWEITGWVQDPVSQMGKLGLLLMPSLFEGLPLAALESACLGIPVIAAPFNGATELASRTPLITVCRDTSLDGWVEAVRTALEMDWQARMQEANRFQLWASVERMADDFLAAIR